MIKNRRTDILRYIIYIVSLGFIFYIMKCCPMINDDFKFLSYNKESFDEMLSFSLYYGNGRLLGNFLSILLIRHPLLIAIEKSVVIFLVILLISKIFSYGFKAKELTIYIISYIMVMSVSPKVLQEVFTWFTCFQNYVMPIAGLVACIYLIRIDERKRLKIPTLILIAFFAFTSQLYLELNTVVNIFFAAVLLFICIKFDRRRIPKAATFAVSSVLGGVLMYLIPRLFYDSDRAKLMEKYRKVNLDSLETFRRSFVDNSSLSLYKLETSLIPVLILGICTFMIISNFCKNEKLKRFGVFASVFFPVVIIVFQTLPSNQVKESKLFYPALFMVSLVLFIIAIALAVFSMERGFEKDASAVLLLLSAASFAPITVVSPFGARCAYLFIFFLFCTAVSMAVYLLKNNLLGTTANLILAVTACVLTAHIGMSYCDLERLNKERDAYINSQLEKGDCEVIEIPSTPNLYMHDTAVYMYGAYYYREKPFDTQFRYVDSSTVD